MFTYTSYKKGRPGSLADKIKNLGDYFIVAQQSDVYRFAYFNNHADFLSCRTNLPQTNTYHEVATRRRKPCFDIDIKRTKDMRDDMGEYVRNKLVHAIYKVFKDKYNIVITAQQNIVVAGGDSPEKFSFHVVVDGFCHPDSDEAREFASLVRDKVPDDCKEYIDMGMYSSSHNLRLLFERKKGTSRIKEFQKVWKYKKHTITWEPMEEPQSDLHLRIMQFGAAGITTNLKLCKLLPRIVVPKDPSCYEDLEELTRGETKEAFSLYKSADCIQEEVVGRIIKLKRMVPGLCITCERVHDKQDPFLFVSPGGAVWFYCRRSDNRTSLGYISEDSSSNEKSQKTIESDHLPRKINEKYLQKPIESEDKNAPLPRKINEKYLQKPIESEDENAPLPRKINEKYLQKPIESEDENAPLPRKINEKYLQKPIESEDENAPLPRKINEKYLQKPIESEDENTPLPRKINEKYLQKPIESEDENTPLPRKINEKYLQKPIESEDENAPLPRKINEKYLQKPIESFQLYEVKPLEGVLRINVVNAIVQNITYPVKW